MKKICWIFPLSLSVFSVGVIIGMITITDSWMLLWLSLAVVGAISTFIIVNILDKNDDKES